MKVKISVHFIVRASSALVFALLVLCDFLTGRSVCPQELCADIWWALLVLIVYPSSHESVYPCIPLTAVAAVAAISLKLMDLPLAVQVIAGSALALVSVIRRSVMKFSDIEPLFHVSGVWYWIEDYTWQIHVCIFIIAGIAAAASEKSAVISWLLALSLAALYYVEYKRVYTRKTMFLSARKEEEIRKAQKGSAFKPPIRFVDSDSRSAALFNDVVSIMENRKPWLQDDFGVDDLARMTHTNRMYLSKAVNFHSGRNFNQLVNYYRVRYAKELIRKDPSLKMVQVAQMSGFHTVVSFNMAFKLNERMTPTEYAQSLKRLQP